MTSKRPVFELQHVAWGHNLNNILLFVSVLLFCNTLLRQFLLQSLIATKIQNIFKRWIMQTEVQIQCAAIVSASCFLLSYSSESSARSTSKQVYADKNEKTAVSAGSVWYLFGSLSYFLCYVLYNRRARQVNQAAIDGSLLSRQHLFTNRILDIVSVVTILVCIYLFVEAAQDSTSLVYYFIL